MKRKRLDILTRAISNQNKSQFQLHIEMLSIEHLYLLLNENLLFWINMEVCQMLTFNVLCILYEFIFQHDLGDWMETLIVPAYDCLYCIRRICIENAFKCLQKIKLVQGHDYFRVMLYPVLGFFNLSIVKYIWEYVINKKHAKRCLAKLLNHKRPMDIIQWAIENGFTCFNINKFIKTELEKQWIIKIAKTYTWGETSLLFSQKSTRQLRIQCKSQDDKQLHLQTQFANIPKSNQGYSFLFMQLYYQLQYKRLLQNSIGITDIELIIEDYLKFETAMDFNCEPNGNFKFL